MDSICTPEHRCLEEIATGFEGAVQAMGFRFRIDEPVVPMRLSAFNGGELHNIVYVFSDQSVKIPELPEAFVKGKISGEQLYKNMTEPLPVFAQSVSPVRASSA